MIGLALPLVLSLACLLLLVRVAQGPAQTDRLIALQGLLLCAALLAATFHGRDPRWVDAALAIVLIGAALLAAGVKALLKQSFQPPLGASEGGAP